MAREGGALLAALEYFFFTPTIFCDVILSYCKEEKTPLFAKSCKIKGGQAGDPAQQVLTILSLWSFDSQFHILAFCIPFLTHVKLLNKNK